MSIIVIKTNKQFLDLKIGKDNRCVDIEDSEGYWTEKSIKSSKNRCKTVKGFIDNYGWIPPAGLWCYCDEEGKCWLFEGNTRLHEMKLNILDKKIDYENLPDFYHLRLRNIADEINPFTGNNWTYEEASKFLNGLNIHTQTKHNIDDTVDTECHKNNPLAEKIREISNKFDIPTTLSCDITLGISGSSRNNYVDSAIINGKVEDIVEYCEDFASFIDEIYWNSKDKNSKVNYKSKPLLPAIFDIYKSFRNINLDTCELFKEWFLKVSKTKEFHNSIDIVIRNGKNNATCKQKILQFFVNYKSKSQKDTLLHKKLISSLNSKQIMKIESFIMKPTVKNLRFNF